jgi:hypothetical protein
MAADKKEAEDQNDREKQKGDCDPFAHPEPPKVIVQPMGSARAFCHAITSRCEG